MSQTVTHQLKLDATKSPTLGPKVRLERHFYCTCGKKFYGYDNHVTAAFRAHKKGA